MKKFNILVAPSLIVATLLLTLSACSGSSEDGGHKRFIQSKDGVKMVTDTKYGCEYIRFSDSSSWTYVHGSCPNAE